VNDLPTGIPLAPAWSLWAGQAGKACIWFAIALFAIAAILWILRPKTAAVEVPAKLSFNLGALCLFGAFGLLATLFAKDQFQYLYVFEHGDSTTDLKYKIAGVWTAQQGSFLLWACTSALFALLTIRGTGPYRRWFSVVFAVFLGTLASILAYETPFDLNPIAQAHGKIFLLANGEGMTPSLQNYWVVIHPPTIFSGFGSLAVFFAYAVAAMLTPSATDWVQRLRPWVLLSTGILGLGICMGGLWAYETLGWGGFWGWDPVEIASFIPWLFTVVLAHGILVQVTRGKWLIANLFLAGLPFISFVYGTFLTRSGLLDKVSNHSFAEMDKHALIVLRWFMIIVSIAFVALWALKAPRLAAAAPKPEADEPGVTREGFYRFGMLLVAMIAVVITAGMSWPVITALRGGTGKAVEEGLYHLSLVWFFVPTMLLMAVAPFVTWRAMGSKELWNRLSNVLCIAIGLTGFIQLAFMSPSIGVHALAGSTVAAPFGFRIALPFWMLVLTFVCVFVIVANVWRIIELSRRSPLGIGGFIAHLGIATLLGGLIVSRGYEQKERIFVREGSPATALGYVVTYKGMTHLDPYDRNGRVFFNVQAPDGEQFEASPGLYSYGPKEEEPKTMVWPSIQHYPSHDIYLAMAPPIVTAWDKPVTILPGQRLDESGTIVEYLKPTRHGQPGTVGVSFGAQVRLTTREDDGSIHQYTADPSVQFTDSGLVPSMPQIGPDYRIAMMGGMNAADRSVQLMLFFSPPVFAIDFFYKPLTCLVWGGMVVMTIGGLMSAYARRRVTAAAVKAKRAQAPLMPAPEVT
jgi:cytochrome c-type biogenesis protein CcmF